MTIETIVAMLQHISHIHTQQNKCLKAFQRTEGYFSPTFPRLKADKCLAKGGHSLVLESNS